MSNIELSYTVAQAQWLAEALDNLPWDGGLDKEHRSVVESQLNRKLFER